MSEIRGLQESRHASGIRGRLMKAQEDMLQNVAGKNHGRGPEIVAYDCAAMRYAQALREAREAGIQI